MAVAMGLGFRITLLGGALVYAAAAGIIGGRAAQE
jgi:hypothetical protein